MSQAPNRHSMLFIFITVLIAANAQGELQGGITSVMSLSNIVAPLMMTQLFAFFSSQSAPLQFSGAPFLTAALLVAAALLGFARATSRFPLAASLAQPDIPEPADAPS
jgi:phosphoglycerol transferase MdoB-like AlkP superfamily enzyme